MQNAIFALFSLVRSAINGELLSENEKLIYSEEILPKIASIAKTHDIEHLIAVAVDINKLAGKEVLVNSLFKSIFQYEQLNHTFCILCDALEKAEIPFIPLKGSVIRKFYREPWLRTSCDIDILVHKEDLDKVVSYLVDNLGYTKGSTGSHDVSLFTSNKIHIELHYDLVEDEVANKASQILKDVWSNAFVRDKYEYFYEMPDEMFYFYHIAHMAKHFENGGCGIRPFIDLWILDGIDGADIQKRDELLKKGDLLKFAEISRRLSKVWFANSEHTDITKQMEQYILRGGMYGTNENRVVIQQQKKGGRLKYALSKIFIPYDTIKFHYPILQKHRWLTPIMELRRWFKLAFCGHAQRSIKELKYNNNISTLEAEKIRAFLESVGL